MKKCKGCKREVSDAKWSYKDDLCKSCCAREKYRFNHPELRRLLRLTKEELLAEFSQLKRTNTILQNSVDMMRGNQIRHFRNRLYRIRNSIDYLLKHPFSIDISVKRMEGKK